MWRVSRTILSNNQLQYCFNVVFIFYSFQVITVHFHTHSHRQKHKHSHFSPPHVDLRRFKFRLKIRFSTSLFSLYRSFSISPLIQDDITWFPGILGQHFILLVMKDPCVDFHEFACGNFHKNAIIPDDETDTGICTAILSSV